MATISGGVWPAGVAAKMDKFLRLAEINATHEDVEFMEFVSTNLRVHLVDGSVHDLPPEMVGEALRVHTYMLLSEFDTGKLTRPMRDVVG